jgi:hypothetical protein
MAVNDTYRNTAGSPAAELPAVACSACAHPWAEHDQIGARFCAATTVGRHDRGCVCATRPSTKT